MSCPCKIHLSSTNRSVGKQRTDVQTKGDDETIRVPTHELRNPKNNKVYTVGGTNEWPDRSDTTTSQRPGAKQSFTSE